MADPFDIYEESGASEPRVPAAGLTPLQRYEQENQRPRRPQVPPVSWKRRLAALGLGVLGGPGAAEAVVSGPRREAEREYERAMENWTGGYGLAKEQEEMELARRREQREQGLFNRQMSIPMPETPEGKFGRLRREAGELGLEAGTPEYNEYVSGRELGYKPEVPPVKLPGRDIPYSPDVYKQLRGLRDQSPDYTAQAAVARRWAAERQAEIAEEENMLRSPQGSYVAAERGITADSVAAKKQAYQKQYNEMLRQMGMRPEELFLQSPQQEDQSDPLGIKPDYRQGGPL